MQHKQIVSSQQSAISGQHSESGIRQRFASSFLPTAFLLLLTAYCSLLTAHAQDTGGVKGKIRNMRGDSIAGASITARQDGKDVRSATSNNKGEFLLDRLTPGLYSIVFEAKGYSLSSFRNSVEIKKKKVIDLGGNLILQTDRGTMVIIRGSVFFKDGTSVAGAKVEVEKITDGSTKKLGSGFSSYSGEFTFSQPEGHARYRVTATYKGSTASKEIEVESAAIYSMAISLDINRDGN